MRFETIAVSRTALKSERIAANVRIAVVSDLHGCRYGAGQGALMHTVSAEAPDWIALTGDIFDAHENEDAARTALKMLSEEYPCFYVTGNHERNGRRVEQIKAFARGCGVTVLGGRTARRTFNGQSVLLCGLDDHRRGSAEQARELRALAAGLDGETYAVLLCHRPEHCESLLARGFDLMLSGHTHGGQWRVPPAKNGLYAPGQGWFPRYAGGRYDIDGRTLVVSRGLSRKPYLVPRLGNPPELTIVTLTPGR